MEVITCVDDIKKNLIENEVCIKVGKVSMANSKIRFQGINNRIIFVGTNNSAIELKNTSIDIQGDNNLVIINHSKYPLILNIVMGHGCVVYLGKNFFSPNAVNIIATEMSNVYIGEWCMFARDVWIRTSDMHLIFDCNSKERINYNKDVYVGEHIWVGQDAYLAKGTVIGSGGIIGMRTLCNGAKYMQVNSVYAGTPAACLRKDVMWRHKGSKQITVDEMIDGIYDTWDNSKYIYNQEEMDKQYSEFENVMFRNPDINKKQDYLLLLDKS